MHIERLAMTGFNAMHPVIYILLSVIRRNAGIICAATTDFNKSRGRKAKNPVMKAASQVKLLLIISQSIPRKSIKSAQKIDTIV